MSTKAFTIIETLVAITILMIAVAGPLAATNRGLIATAYAREQMTANFLAQEGIEQIKALRQQSIIINGVSGAFAIFPGVCYGSAAVCRISVFDPSSSYPLVGVCQKNPSAANTCTFYKNSSGQYTHTIAGNTVTNFKRWFHIEGSGQDEEVTAVVDVEWRSGGVTATTTMRTRLRKVERF